VTPTKFVAERTDERRVAADSIGLIAAIVQSSNDAIMSVDLDGLILTWNPAAERMLGFTEAEMVGKSITTFVAPELRDEQLKLLDRLRRGEHLNHYETIRITKAGEPIDVALTLSPIRDARGSIVGITGIVRDIREQKQSEQALLHRLAFEKFLFELSKTFIGLTEEEIDECMASGLAHVGAFLKMDRVTLLQLSGDRDDMSVVYSWSAPGVPTSPPVISKRYQPWWIGQVLRGEVSLASRPDDLPDEAAAEREYLRQRGIQSAASIPLRVGGEIAGVISYVTVHREVAWTEELVNELRAVGDVLWNALKRRQTMQALHSAREAAERALRESEVLRASEERYRGLAEQVVDAIFVTDPAARALDANGVACELLGYTLQELKALRPEDVIVAEELPRLGEMLRLANSQVVRTEFHFRRKDGSVFTGDVAGRQLPDGRLQAVIRDITELKEVEDLERRLHQLAMLPLNEANLQEVLGAIVETAIAITHADFGNIQLLDPKSSTLHIVAHRGFPQWWIDYWATVPEEWGVCGTALELGHRVVVDDVERSPIFSATDLDMQRKAGVRAVQSTPLVSLSGKPIGMLSTHFKTPFRPNERSLVFVDLLAREAADIIAHVQGEAELKRQAALLDLAHNIIFVRDREGHITYWNDAAAECYGWSREEALGQVSHVLLQTQFPEPLERVVDILKRTGRWEGELVQSRRDGRRI